MLFRSTTLVSLLALACAGSGAPAQSTTAEAQRRAAATEAAMTDAERTVLTHGIMALPFGAVTVLPPEAVPGAGYVAGVRRLNVPALTESDASLGVSWVSGARKDGGATALPSGMAMGATWDPDLLRRGGAMIGGEARAKGFNVLLAGGANLIREPRGGRTFEYLGEDPLHSGLLAGAAIDGIQSAHIISTVKHFALNGQETGRHFVNSKIGDAAARESDLLAFQIAIENGHPGAVMCAYNQVNDQQACGNDYLLDTVLKRDWKYPGFVMSDWGAVRGLDFALHGLDQQSGMQLDPALFFGDLLGQAAKYEPGYAARVKDMNRRILYAIYANGLDRDPPLKAPIDLKANGDVAEAVAKEAIVLLRNRGGALPLTASAKRIAVIGGYADSGVLSGGGSSQVQGDGGPAIFLPATSEGPWAGFVGAAYHRSSPLAAIKARVPGTEIVYRNGDYITDAVAAAKNADVAIVFATQWQSEGFDQPDLSLPHGQDALIAAVADANPNTIVVLETGSAVLMPWLDKTAAVLEAWYPGARGGPAIASVLFGDTNPGGRLPITFPASVDQLPRPKLDGSDVLDPDFLGKGKPGQTLTADYDIEGSDVGYRWFARKQLKPLFPFGFGLSYTDFTYSGLKATGGRHPRATLTVTNSGAKPGSDVPQLYLVSAAAKPLLRLVGFKRVALAPGQSKAVEFAIDPRLLADWAGAGWRVAGGSYAFAVGSSAEMLGERVTVRVPSSTMRP